MFQYQPNLSWEDAKILCFAIDFNREDFATPFWIEADSIDHILDTMIKIEWLDEYEHALMRCIFTDDEVIQNEV